MSFVVLLGSRLGFLIVYLIGVFISGFVACDMIKSNTEWFKLRRLKIAFGWPWYLIKWFFNMLFK